MKNGLERAILKTWLAYNRRPRVLTPEVLERIAWQRFNPKKVEAILPALHYFRSTEFFTRDWYYPMLKVETPSGQDRTISLFLDRWNKEEQTHGELFDKVLDLCGQPPYEYPLVPSGYGVSPSEQKARFLLGEAFIALHMTWGAINELTTRWAYRVLWDVVDDPTFRYVVSLIMKEESRHLAFYRHVADILLRSSLFYRVFVRLILKYRWRPVGTDEHNQRELLPIVHLVKPHIPIFEKEIAAHISPLPGLASFNPALSLTRFCNGVIANA